MLLWQRDLNLHRLGLIDCLTLLIFNVSKVFLGMKKNIVTKDKESVIKFKEIWASENLTVNWCDMSFDRKNKIEVYDGGEIVELYFQFNGTGETRHENDRIAMLPNSQGIFYINNYTSEHTQYKGGEKPLSFLEVRLGVDVVQDMFPEELWEEQYFMKNLFSDATIPAAPMKPISPQMKSIICNMCNCPFKGVMQRTCLEAQITELFLLQAESHTPVSPNSLKKKDLEKIVATKEFIDHNYRKKLHVADLARQMGTNQQLLRTGFKTLYDTTIFKYYNDLRMERAKHLLLDQGKFVAEVADDIGYKNPQHFTVAFKKKYGVLPSELRGERLFPN